MRAAVLSWLHAIQLAAPGVCAKLRAQQRSTQYGTCARAAAAAAAAVAAPAHVCTGLHTWQLVMPTHHDAAAIGTYAPASQLVAVASVTVEAYLRLTNIPFTVVYGTVAGPFGKVPFIELNGEQHADSSHIIDVLAAKFGHNLDQGLSAQQKAIGHAFQRMAEESLYFHVIYARWEDDAGWDSTFKAYIGHAGFVMRSLCNYVLRPKFRKICAAQGTGRFPPSVVVERFGKDMQALSDYLGENDFLLGTAAPTTVDIAVFGQLDSLFNAGVTTLLDEKVAEFPTLAAYVQRIAKLVFPPASAA
ncbi:hypothetical protein JKP88DRAFT_246066 [Tribonema minus]|uniref:Glutathione S-transferase n=1 Tax=Tribonema minus TaxID=303371 RepID=A0A835YU58_9STRA|nr:hypothetical protein JKP88DRAFT_246066 [Tribonema minus]